MNKKIPSILSIILMFTFVLTLPSCYKGHIEIIDLYATVQNCQPPYIVAFDRDIDVGRGDIEYSWNFGDGQKSSESKPMHVFNTPGVYTVQLTVKNKEKTDIKSIVLDISASSLPIISDFDYSSIGGNYFAPSEVTFANLSEHATSYIWNFGDGYGSLDFAPTHIYNNAGNFTAKLGAICSGDTVYSTIPITIKPQPSRIFVNNVSVTCPNSYLGVDLYCKVYYDIHNEMTSNTLYNIGQFPVTWGFSKELFFFDESYNSRQIIIEFWDTDDIYDPVFTVSTTTRQLQEDYYPSQVHWSNNNGFACDLYLSYNN